jgi:alkylation response protein AidB-like acyl-CoA dehydrogenase
MRRTIYEPDHEDLRESLAKFLAKEVAPHNDEWEEKGIVPKEVILAAGELGFLAPQVPEEYGGVGVEDFRFNAIIGEEVMRQGYAGFGLCLTLHNDICLPYMLEYCTEEQKERWLPGMVTGEHLTAIAMTEPEIGSDLANMRTTATKDNGSYVLDGSKTFITNGINADLIVTAVKTDPKAKHSGISLMIVEEGSEGFERGRNLEKLGIHSQDTAELFFNSAKVPAENLLGEEGQGFKYLVSNLAQERLSIAIQAISSSEGALDLTLEYVKERTAFGRPVGTFQNSRFELAEMKTEIDIGRSFVDRCVQALGTGDLTPEDAAEVKWWTTELQGRVMDRCLQLFGGYGYMLEYPISRYYADARITRIYGGTTEIMKEIVGRSLGLGDPR